MLTKLQIDEIRQHLQKAQNPVFFYDNDADGFCSYVLLRKFAERGKGVVIRSHPDIDQKYAKKIQELNADYVFVLDRPVLGKNFVDEVKEMHLPLVWIDHHDGEEDKNYENLFTYNPNKAREKSSEPVSYWSYKVSNRKEDMWIAMMGCISDHYLPEFSEEFKELYPELWSKEIKEPFEAYYKTEIGKLAKVIGFALKDSLTHVIQLQNFLIQCKSANEMLNELESSKPFVQKYKEINKKYQLLLNKAKRNSEDKILFFNYGGDLSISSDISNELSYIFSDKVIIVAYTSGPITNISMRGKNVKKVLENAIEKLQNATGGGHPDAVGARIQTSDLEKFKEGVYQELGKWKK